MEEIVSPVFQAGISANFYNLSRAVFRAIFGAILLTVFSVAANAACPGSLPKTLTNSTTANADDVMANFNYLLSNCGGGGGGSSQWTTSGSNVYYNSGNVGIGATNPDVKLVVVGASNPGFLIGTAQVGGTYGYLEYHTAGSGYLRLTSGLPTVPLVLQDTGGNVGIGTTSPSYTLHVNGTAYATGAAGALSDLRDKKDIALLPIAALDAIIKLRPVTFAWKEAKDDGMKGRQMGLVAQEVEKVLPSAILTASDKRKSKAIKYNELTAVLIKAVQEQQKLIAEQNKVVRLQGQELRHQASELRSQSTEILRLQLANQSLEARLARVERNRVARAN